MRYIKEYEGLSKQQLYGTLADIVHDLSNAIDEQGFLRSQEIETKKTAWEADPDASIQARDRAASYSASHITAQLYVVSATIAKLQLERDFVERLIDAAP